MSAIHEKFSLLIKEQKFDEALILCQRSLDQSPNSAEIIGLRGVARFYLKDIHCLDDLNEAIRIDPENPYRYSSRAYIIDILGDTEAAIQDYLKAIELDPEDHIAHNNLGMLQDKLGRKELAQNHFQKSDQLMGIEKNKYAFPEENLQHRINAEKKLGVFSILKRTLTNREGWKEFISFVRNKF